jgi:hypothetical protein
VRTLLVTIAATGTDGTAKVLLHGGVSLRSEGSSPLPPCSRSWRDAPMTDDDLLAELAKTWELFT